MEAEKRGPAAAAGPWTLAIGFLLVRKRQLEIRRGANGCTLLTRSDDICAVTSTETGPTSTTEALVDYLESTTLPDVALHIIVVVTC